MLVQKNLNELKIFQKRGHKSKLLNEQANQLNRPSFNNGQELRNLVTTFMDISHKTPNNDYLLSLLLNILLHSEHLAGCVCLYKGIIVKLVLIASQVSLQTARNYTFHGKSD